MSAHDEGVLGAGTDPPPLSSEPRKYVPMSDGRVIAWRSACVIWPTFSARVIRDNRSFTRSARLRDESRYGSPCALMTTVDAAPSGTPAPVLFSVTGIVSASSADPSLSTGTGNVLVVADAVPVSKVSVPEAGS